MEEKATSSKSTETAKELYLLIRGVGCASYFRIQRRVVGRMLLPKASVNIVLAEASKGLKLCDLVKEKHKT